MVMEIKKILREPLFYLLPLLAVAYLIVIPAKVEILDAKTTRSNVTENIKLPYSNSSDIKEEFLISFKLDVKNNGSVKYNLIPDDCIQEILINEKKFPIEGVKGICNYIRGAYFDFSEYTQKGLNDFRIRIINNGGPGGLRIEVPYNGFKSLSIMHYIFTFFLLLSIALILKKFKFKFIANMIILLGISVRLITYAYMGPTQSPFDVGAHLEYIQIVAEEQRVPTINEGWSTYHPPLYYLISAAIKNVADSYEPGFTGRILQQFNLLLSFGSVIFGVALIIGLFGNRWVAYLAALASVLWPGFVLAGPRINNDIFFYFGALFCMFFAQRYWLSHKNSDVLFASIGASIAIAAKSTGVVILGVWAIIYVLNVLRSLKICSLRTLFVSIFIIALFAGFSNYRQISTIFEGGKVELVQPINSLNSALRVQNTVGNYLYFDIKDYLLVPYTSAWNDKGGRQYFWNYLLKSSSSLHGETEFEALPIGGIISTGLNICVLLIFLLALWGMIHVKAKEFPALLFTIGLFAALISFRVMYPYSCHNEFRFIFPVMFPLAYFAASGAQLFLNYRIRKFAYIILLSFAGLSVIFILGKAL